MPTRSRRSSTGHRSLCRCAVARRTTRRAEWRVAPLSPPSRLRFCRVKTMLENAKAKLARLYRVAQKTPGAMERVKEIAPKAYAFVRGGDAKRQAIANEFLSWALHQQAALEFAQAEDAAKGFAAELLRPELDFTSHLEATPHFGAIQDLSSLKLSRRSYTLLTLQSLLDLKVQYPGLGLGSKGVAASSKGTGLTCLEVAQSFTILANSAHLFGTFATERGLLFALRADSLARRELTTGICGEDLRTFAEDVITRGQLHRLHYVQACLFTSSLSDNALRATCLAVLREVLLTRQEKLLWSLRLARQVAYNRIHALAQLDCSLQSGQYRRLLDQARLSRRVGFVSRAHESSPALDLLNAIDTYQTRVFFTGPEVARLVVHHFETFSQWWAQKQSARIHTRDLVAALRTRPSDWPESQEPAPLTHFVRVRLPATVDWIAETRGLTEDASAWRESKFLITPSPDAGGVPSLDVFTTGAVSAATAHCLAVKLTRYTADTWANTDAEWSRWVWQSNVEVALSVLQELVQEGYRVELLPTDTREPHRVGYGMFCDDVERAVGRLQEFRNLVADDARRAELAGLEDMIRQFGRPTAGGQLFVALGNVVLISSNENVTAGEIDGLFAQFLPDSIKWFFYEHKRTKDSSKARSQLNRLGEKLRISLEVLLDGRTGAGGAGVLYAGESHATATSFEPAGPEATTPCA